MGTERQQLVIEKPSDLSLIWQKLMQSKWGYLNLGMLNMVGCFLKSMQGLFSFFNYLAHCLRAFTSRAVQKKNLLRPFLTRPFVTNSRRESKNLKCLMSAKKFYILKRICSFQRSAAGWFKYMWTFREHQALKG